MARPIEKRITSQKCGLKCIERGPIVSVVALHRISLFALKPTVRKNRMIYMKMNDTCDQGFGGTNAHQCTFSHSICILLCCCCCWFFGILTFRSQPATNFNLEIGQLIQSTLHSNVQKQNIYCNLKFSIESHQTIELKFCLAWFKPFEWLFDLLFVFWLQCRRRYCCCYRFFVAVSFNTHTHTHAQCTFTQEGKKQQIFE